MSVDCSYKVLVSGETYVETVLQSSHAEETYVETMLKSACAGRNVCSDDVTKCSCLEKNTLHHSHKVLAPGENYFWGDGTKCSC